MNLFKSIRFLSISRLFVFVVTVFLCITASMPNSDGPYEKPAAAIQSTWNPLPPVDFSTISPDFLADWLIDRPASQGENQDIDYYIGHFHRLANAVRTSDPNKGFIDISVWRNPADNEPYNARIMENITTRAWFYTREEAWNPYYGDPDLRKILEAALTFWVSIQNDNGRFSEYGENKWNLAATAFATKFMGRTLEMLQDGPPIDPVIHEHVKESNRKALMVVFTSESLYDHGRRFSNQYGNAFTGAMAHLDMNPDDTELREAFLARLETSLDDFQRPAGYFYEHFGPDWGYAFGTHHSNILMAWHYARHDEELAAHYAAEHAHFIDWLSYNAVKQPGDEFFMLHRSIESRQSRALLRRLETPLSEAVPLARAFNVTSEEAAQRVSDIRQRVSSNWGNIPSLQTGNFSGYSAYVFLHRDHYRWNPSEAQRQEAVMSLPYLASDNFIHQRVDDLTHFETTFVRKPTYYAAFSAGEQEREKQRFGLGLLWNPVAGTLFQSQSESEDAAWGTVMHTRISLPYEALPVEASYSVDGVPVEPVAGAGDLEQGVLEIFYPLGSTGRLSGIGEKKLRFEEDVITVEVAHQGDFTEILPLVVRDISDIHINHERGVIQTIQRGRFGYEQLRIEIADPEDVESIFVHNARSLGADMNLQPVHIIANGSLSYTITLNPQEPLFTENTGTFFSDSPQSILLAGNYPNPFNPVTHIVFELNTGSDVHLDVYNVMGERVLSQNVGFYGAGRHTARLEAGHLASGVYLVRLEANGQAQSMPVTIIK
jgi:hypothetical protein